MPVRTVETAPGVRVFEFTCEACGAEASFGIGGSLRDAIKTGDPKRAGQWFCVEHRPAETSRAA